MSEPRKASRAPDACITVTVRLTVAEAAALAGGSYACISTNGWREADRALATVKEAVTARLAAWR